ncbi:MAG: ABC transporter ATP-binding protein [Campylobacterales bacterium]|nr:ABC transporter ATP-binding protein [Campylobacterales bacterium]MBN2832918.1 ABC transporter ATP-binding protein [Campylobacterales bacterium]
MHKNIAIKVQNLTKIYKLYEKPIDRLKESLHPFKKKYHREFHALNDFSFEIHKGETVGIIGKNGSGKSTLLKIITGVLTPTSGRVTVHGKISAILELGAGFNPDMTGLENIYLNTSINGMNKAETDKKIDEIIAFAELGEHINQPIKTYSSGMKARLAFSVSISVEPDILIVDEALSVGDVAFARKCFAKMEEIRAKGATILFVSHSEGSVVSLCNRAIWISNGTQIIDGIPKLVTGLYMKYINEKKVDKIKIEIEYINLVNTKNEKQEEEAITKKKEVNTSLLKIENSKLENSFIEEFYNPALVAKSTICYEEKGAKISDVKITTLDGRKVNVLIHGREYIFMYRVDTKGKDLKQYRFGCLIKSVDGIPIGGCAYPSKNEYIERPAGEFFVNIYFKCILNNGEYFFNCGISSLMNETNDYAHRIIDAYAIKVINSNQNSTSKVNFIQNIYLESVNNMK